MSKRACSVLDGLHRRVNKKLSVSLRADKECAKAIKEGLGSMLKIVSKSKGHREHKYAFSPSSIFSSLERNNEAAVVLV